MTHFTASYLTQALRRRGAVMRGLHLVAASVLLCAAGLSAAQTETPTAKLSRATVDARATQSALLNVSAFGRYAIVAESAQGVALQLVDRMAGAGGQSGEPGKQDGRLDLFLDRGEYKIVTQAAEKGKGTAKLSAHAFRELHAHPPMLIEHRLERSTLGDFEQRSYWIDIKQKQVVVLEAAGRNLADLRLWRDGTWLVDAEPKLAQSQAHRGQPLQVARLSAELEPGLYLLTAYGGASQPWTEASDAKPFYLRFGIPMLAPAMRQQFTMSEFGTDRFLVPAGPNYFRLELPSAQPATLEVGGYDEAHPFDQHDRSASIDKQSLPPVTEVYDTDDGMKEVTVSMEAGKSFVLQHFDAETTVHFKESGPHWLGSIHAGAMEDSVGADAVLTSQWPGGNETFLDEQVLELANNTSWHRRFNLLDELTLFIKLSAPAKIRVDGTGVTAHYRFEPFLVSRPWDYKTPPWRDSGYVFELDRGLHVLTVTPGTKGILDLHLSAGDAKPSAAMSPLQPAVRFSPVSLQSNTSYTLYLNHQPGVVSGAVLRPLPIDLRYALPVTQRAGETLTIPVSVDEHASLQAVAEDGSLLDIALDNGKSGTSIDVERGYYSVIVKGADHARGFSLRAEPVRLSSTTPLPPLPDARLASLPKFPVITPDEPRFTQLGARSSTVHQVRVDKPGLYRFESTGLLDTGGTVRTRTNPSLFSEKDNGVGRNFLIQRYLREGDYQLSVSTQGQTQGPLGIQIARTEIHDGGELHEGQIARTLLPTGHAVAYRFKIAQRGTYHLQTLGLGRNFDIRLEDEGGWPVGDPVRKGDLTQMLAPGSYRVLVMPQTAEARVLTRLDRVAEPPTYKGHGPHRIALDTPAGNMWAEPAKGAARTPDQWEFTLRAPAEVTIALDNDMEGVLTGAGDAKHAPLAQINARQAWRGTLQTGRYVIRAVNSRSNNYVHYTVRVAATQLIPGQWRVVTAPATIPVSVGADGLVELQSFGASDVRAQLMNGDGEAIAQNDDREDDWNFHIAQRLRPGEYKLIVDPVGEKHAQTTISMDAPAEVAEKPLASGVDAEIADAQVHIYPLMPTAENNVVLAQAQSGDVVGLALEGQSADGWMNLGTTMRKAPYLVLPLPSGMERFKAYRLRAWSADRSGARIHLHAIAATLPATPEVQWPQGVAGTVIDKTRPELHVAMVAMARPGTFRVKGDTSHLQWSDSGARAAQGSGPVISIGGRTLWLVSEDARSEGLAAQRLRLPTTDQESLRLELSAGQIGTVDLSAQQTPSLVIAQSRIGQPGISVGATRDPHAMGPATGEAVAAVLPGMSTASSMWNAGASAPIELDVRQVLLQAAAAQSTGIGVSEGMLASHAALPVKLPGNAPQVHLTLDPMTAAVFVKHGAVQSTHWSGAEALHETVSGDADQIWLLNADSRAVHYGLEIDPAGGAAEPALKPGGMVERNVSTAGRLSIPVEFPATGVKASDVYTIRVRGNGTALWLEKGGRIAAGNDIRIMSGGELLLQHQPGTVVAWMDAPPAQSAKGMAEWIKAFRETAVKPPQTIDLHDKQQVLKFQFDHASMLHVRTSVPVVAQFVAEGQPPRTEVYLNGANINLFAPAGTSRLLLRAIGSDSLSGMATAMTTPIVRLGEGAGPESLLAPGSARLFSFELKDNQTIGIGVRASSDVVRSVVYDEHGAIMSEGVVQMPTLAPGRYFLAIEMPPASEPVRVRPIMLGLGKPDTRPPFDVLRRYVENKEEIPLIYVPPAPEPPPSEAQEQPEEEQSASEPQETEQSEQPADTEEPASEDTNEGTQEGAE